MFSEGFLIQNGGRSKATPKKKKKINRSKSKAAPKKKTKTTRRRRLSKAKAASKKKPIRRSLKNTVPPPPPPPPPPVITVMTPVQLAEKQMKNAAMEKQIKNAAMSAAAMAAVMAAAASARAEQQLKNAAAAAAVADALVAQKRLKNAAVSVTGASASQEAAAAVVAAQMAKLHLARAAENAALKQIKNAEAAAAVAAAAATISNLQPITLRPETLPSDEAHRVVLLFCNNGGWEAVKNLPLTDSRSIFVRDLLQKNVEEITKLFYLTQAELSIIKEKHNTNTNVNKKLQLAKNIENKIAVKALLYQVMSWLQLCNSKKQKKQQLETLFAGIKNVAPDGWCFYHSIITGLEHSSNNEKAIKLSHEVVQWLRDNRSTRLSNGQTIEERYNSTIGNSIIPIYNSRYGSSRALSMDEYLFYSSQETATMAPVVWPEVAIVGYAIANLKNVQLIIYSDQTGEPTASYRPFQTRPTKVVSLWHSDNNHFDLLVPRV